MSKKMKELEAMAGAGNERPGGKLEPVAQNALGRELRAMYDQLVSEPIPNRFIELLDQLEQAESRAAEPSDRKSSRTNRG